MKFLIVGVNSLLGSALEKALSKKGHTVIGTRRRVSDKSNSLQFDLSTSPENWPDWPLDIDAVFIAAAVTSQEVCLKGPEYADFINVSQTLLLIEQLRNLGTHILYPSTNLVLPCIRTDQSVETAYGPIGTYGENKATVEKVLRQYEGVTIARLPKILDISHGILRSWSQQIDEQKTVKVYTNLIVSPVSLAYCMDFLLQLMVRQPGGIWHLSGAEEFSYAEVAQAFIRSRNYPSGTERLLNYSQMDTSKGALPRHPGLDCSETEKVLGIAPQKLDHVFL